VPIEQQERKETEAVALNQVPPFSEQTSFQNQIILLSAITIIFEISDNIQSKLADHKEFNRTSRDYFRARFPSPVPMRTMALV
jgi:hypothetical protein